MRVTGTYEHAASFRESADARQSNVVLMDVRLANEDGVELVRELRAESGPAYLMISAFNEDERVIEALEAGASGFLMKTEDPSEIVRAVRAAAAGDVPLSPRSARQVTSWVRSKSSPERRGAAERRLASLTEREREIARAMTEGPSDAQLAAQFHLSASSIKSHVSSIMSKLGLRNRTQIAVLAARAEH